MPLRTALALILLALGSRAVLGGQPEAQSEHPNILLILIDDLGWQDLSVPLHIEATPFNERYRTPNVERLAREGLRFTNAYASAPVCTPTRTSIMTGMSPARSHITYWTLHKDRDTSANHPTLAPPDWRLNGLQPGDVTLPALLADAGYRTIHVGKAHFGTHDTPGGDPTNLGFEVNIGGHASGGPASYYGTHNFTVAGRQGKDPTSATSVWDIPGLEKYHGQDIFLTEALAIEAISEIERAAADGVPFFMNFAPYAVHAPIMANTRLLEHYPDLDPREAAYATMIESCDNAIGELLDALERLGTLDNTVIIFHSDNGGLSAHARGPAPDGSPAHTHNAPLRSGKGSAYEGGIRVPMIVRWPGVVAADSITDTPTISHDLFPTFLAIADVAVPEDHLSQVDGRDLTPLLQGEPTDLANRPLLWHMPHEWGPNGPGIDPFSALRIGPWKILYFHAETRFELYNLDDDIGESNDLARTQVLVLRRLVGELDRRLRESGASMSKDKQTKQPIPLPFDAMKREQPEP